MEEIFGWMKTVGGFRRTRYRGVARTVLAGYLVATAYNLVPLARLLDELETATPGGPGEPPRALRAHKGCQGACGTPETHALGLRRRFQAPSTPIPRTRVVPKASQTYSLAAC